MRISLSRRRARALHAGLANVCCLIVLQTACLAAQKQHSDKDWRKDDFSWIKGMNYTPSYAPNDVVTWRDFDAEVVDRELGHAKKLGLNSVRTWLQYIVYEHQPQKFLKNFETFLQLCEKHGIQAMPVLFDSCFGMEPKIDWDGEWVMSPGTSKEMPDYWPKIQEYVDAVVGAHIGDKRIVMWDVMNEPAIFDWTVTFVKHFAEEVRRIDSTHPITVGVAGGAGAASMYAEIEDVLSMHGYPPEEDLLRKEVQAVKELGKKHGKPVIITECCAPGWGQPYEMVMPLLREEGIGWYAWEVTIGVNQFQAVSGLLYPDGTCRRKTEVAAVMGMAADEVPFTEKPDSEGIPITQPKKPAQPPAEQVREVADKFLEYAKTPTTVENLKQRILIIKDGTAVVAQVLKDDDDLPQVIKLWGKLIWAGPTLSEQQKIKHTNEMLQMMSQKLQEHREAKD